MSETFNGFGLNIVALSENDEKLAAWEREQEKYKEQAKLDAYRKSGVPEKFYNSSFDTYIAETEEEKRIKAQVMDFAKSDKCGTLLMCGANGNGKTLLGCSVIRESGGEYLTSTAMCVKYEAAIGYKAEMTRDALLEHWCKLKGVFVIDEIGKYFINPDLEKFLVSTVTCGRYENGRKSVLIGNPKKKPFVEFLGKAVYDRFTESCTAIEFNGESKRKGLRNV